MPNTFEFEAPYKLSKDVKELSEKVDVLEEEVSGLSDNYNHFCKIFKANEFEIHFSFIDKKDESLTLAEVSEKTLTNIPVVGFYFNDSVYISVMTISFSGGNMVLYGFKSSSSNYDIKSKTYSLSDAGIVLSDTVV